MSQAKSQNQKAVQAKQANTGRIQNKMSTKQSGVQIQQVKEKPKTESKTKGRSTQNRSIWEIRGTQTGSNCALHRKCLCSAQEATEARCWKHIETARCDSIMHLTQISQADSRVAAQTVQIRTGSCALGVSPVRNPTIFPSFVFSKCNPICSAVQLL